MIPETSTYSAQILLARRAAKLTGKELATACGFSPAALSNIETSRIEVSHSTFEKIIQTINDLKTKA